MLHVRTVTGSSYGCGGEKPEIEKPPTTTRKKTGARTKRYSGKKVLPSGESATYACLPVDIDTGEITWTVLAVPLQVSVKYNDLAQFVAQSILKKRSPYGSLYQALLEALLNHFEPVVHFVVVRAGTIFSQGGMTFVEVEVPKLENRTFVLPNSFIRDCRAAFLR